MGEPNRPLMTT